MIDQLSPFISVKSYRQIAPAALSAQQAGVKEEFLTVFYKELLKQAFKAPDLTMNKEESQEYNFFSSFNSDLMVEQFAKELAQKSSAQMGLLPVKDESK